MGNFNCRQWGFLIVAGHLFSDDYGIANEHSDKFTKNLLVASAKIVQCGTGLLVVIGATGPIGVGVAVAATVVTVAADIYDALTGDSGGMTLINKAFDDISGVLIKLDGTVGITGKTLEAKYPAEVEALDQICSTYKASVGKGMGAAHGRNSVKEARALGFELGVVYGPAIQAAFFGALNDVFGKDGDEKTVLDVANHYFEHTQVAVARAMVKRLKA